MNGNNFFSRGGSATSVVNQLIILNVVVFLAQSLLASTLGPTRLVDLFGLHLWKSEYFQPYQLVTYMFLHGSLGHLFFNMFALWMFGRIIEYDLGSKRFLIYYMFTGIGAGLINLGVNWFEYSEMASKYALSDPQGLQWWVNRMATIGASGAVFGILLAFGMLHPNDRIMLLIPPIPMKAKYFVIIYGIIELFYGVSRTDSNVAHFAHLGGMLFGIILLMYWKQRGKLYY